MFLANFARIRRLYNKDLEVIQQGSEGYKTRIRRLYNKVRRLCFPTRLKSLSSKLLLIKCVKSPRKKVSYSVNFALLAEFFWYWCYYPHRSRDALSPVCGIFDQKFNFLLLLSSVALRTNQNTFLCWKIHFEASFTVYWFFFYKCKLWGQPPFLFGKKVYILIFLGLFLNLLYLSCYSVKACLIYKRL